MSKHISRNGATASTRVSRNWKNADGDTYHNIGVHNDNNGGQLGHDDGTTTVGAITIRVHQGPSWQRSAWKLFRKTFENQGMVFVEVEHAHVATLKCYRISGPSAVLREGLDILMYSGGNMGRIYGGHEEFTRAIPRRPQGAGPEKVVKKRIQDQQEKYNTVHGKSLMATGTVAFDRSSASLGTLNAGLPIGDNAKNEYQAPPVKDAPNFSKLSTQKYHQTGGSMGYVPTNERYSIDPALLTDVDTNADHFYGRLKEWEVPAAAKADTTHSYVG